MVIWEWELWRCFGDLRWAFEEKGWQTLCCSEGHSWGELPQIFAVFGQRYAIAFRQMDPISGECLFELRELRDDGWWVRQVRQLPKPERAAELLAEDGLPEKEAEKRLAIAGRW
jgi:hypothetical protein